MVKTEASGCQKMGTQYLFGSKIMKISAFVDVWRIEITRYFKIDKNMLSVFLELMKQYLVFKNEASDLARPQTRFVQVTTQVLRFCFRDLFLSDIHCPMEGGESECHCGG